MRLHDRLEKIFDCLTLNFLFLLFSLPVVTAGAAATALYYVTVKVIRKERGGIFSEFIRSFKTNLVKATGLWLLFASLGAILLINRNISVEIGSPLFGLFLVCFYTALAFIALGAAFFAFAALSRFEMPFFWILKIAAYMTFRYIHLTAGVIATLFAAFALSYFQPLFLLFVPVFAVLGASFFAEPALMRHTPAASGAWYMSEDKNEIS